MHRFGDFSSESPSIWTKGPDDWCTEYEKQLETFLKTMMNCE
jgi:hypothetical protein